MKKVRDQLVENYLFNISYQILSILAPVITAPYISRVLGVENVGEYSYATSLVTYFISIAILGSDGYARREIAYKMKEYTDRSILFHELLVFRLITTGISAFLYLFILVQYNFNLIYVLEGINIVGVALDITWFFQGLEKFKLLAVRNFVTRCLNILAVFVFVRSKNDLAIYVFIIAGIPLIGYLWLWKKLPEYLVIGDFQYIHVLRHAKGILKLFVPTIAVAIYGLLDKTMLGMVTDSRENNGYYEQADKIIKMLFTAINSLGVVMAPRMALSIAEKNTDKVRIYMRKSYSYIFMVASLVCIAVIAVADIFVPWFFGTDYMGTVPVLEILAPIVLITGLSSLSGNQYLINARKETAYTVTLFCGAAVNLILNLFLIPRYYEIGAAIATVFGELTIFVSQTAYILCIDRKIKPKDIFLNFRYILMSSIVLIVMLLVKPVLGKDIMSMFILLFVGCATYAIILFITGDLFAKEIAGRIWQVLHKK